ncbi:AAA family ATPase [Ligilactobacillus sp. LYQ135]
MGYENQLELLDSALYGLNTPSAMIIGDPGVGKTSMVKQLAHNRYSADRPLCVVELNIEKLGELNDNVFVSRCREILTDMNKIKEYTAKQNDIENNSYQMALFIDEIHKLNNYGKAHRGKEGSSGAMNALKNDLAAGVFPVIGATTKDEFRNNIEPDKAFSRRLTKIVMEEPPKKVIEDIAKHWLKSKSNNNYIPFIDDQDLSRLIDYSNAYVRDSAQPARTLAMLDKCVGICRKAYLNHKNTAGAVPGLIIDENVIAKAFEIEGHTINTDPKHVQLVIPKNLDKKYNHALQAMKPGKNTLIGYQDQLEMLEACLYRVSEPDALLLGDAGVGKTALIEQAIYNRSLTDRPLCVVSLSIEKLGELNENMMISRMRTLLTDLNEIQKVTREANPDKNFQMALFIDEIHKLNHYGKVDSQEGSSAAMNALKEGLARDEFALIGATTDYEYRRDIVKDTAFDRRFGKIIMKQPGLEDTITIMKRRLASYSEQGLSNIPQCSDAMYRQIIMYSDAFIRNLVNPAKSLSILNNCVGFCRKEHKNEIDHEIIAKAFLSEGYTIDTTTNPEHIIEVVNKKVIGQPLALDQLANVVRNSLYTRRDYKKPLMTALFVGSTGVGKTETAKALAEAFFGRRDAIITLNGGDYATKKDAAKAQHFVGDSMQTDKRKIILLDEIEKSNKQVMDAYMRMIDEGIARDSHGIERSLNSTIIIATSNLGADVFGQLKETLKLDRESNPNKLNTQLLTEWERRKESVKTALLSGNSGRDDGIKPEFLQRFSLMIPFMPLATKSYAMIARMQLEDFVEDMKNNIEYPITIQLPQKESHAYWTRQMSSSTTPFDNDDPISVMIAKDKISKEANKTGAREITNYINNTVKTDVIKLLDYRVSHHLPINGAFRLSVSHASFFDNSGKLSDIKVDYIS